MVVTVTAPDLVEHQGGTGDAPHRRPVVPLETVGTSIRLAAL
ncbi:hypothetical protein [Streptomyces sp. UH6]|nr:hypothetical protein [Streptomyces sp. UH6]